MKGVCDLSQPAARSCTGPSRSRQVQQGRHPLDTAREIARLHEVSKWGGFIFFSFFFSPVEGPAREMKGRVLSPRQSLEDCGYSITEDRLQPFWWDRISRDIMTGCSRRSLSLVPCEMLERRLKPRSYRHLAVRKHGVTFPKSIRGENFTSPWRRNELKRMFYKEIVISSNRKELYHRFIAVISSTGPGQIKNTGPRSYQICTAAPPVFAYRPVPSDQVYHPPKLRNSFRRRLLVRSRLLLHRSIAPSLSASASLSPPPPLLPPSPLHHLFTPPTTTFLNSPLHSFSFLFLFATVLGLNLSRPPSLLNQPCMPSLGSFLFLPTSTYTPSKARHSSHFALSMI